MTFSSLLNIHHHVPLKISYHDDAVYRVSSLLLQPLQWFRCRYRRSEEYDELASYFDAQLIKHTGVMNCGKSSSISNNVY